MLESVLNLIVEPFLHPVRIPLVVLRNDDKWVHFEGVHVLQFAHSLDDLRTDHLTFDGFVTL